MRITYIVPLRRAQPAEPEFFAYLNGLSVQLDVILVDGSEIEVFRAHARHCSTAIAHVVVDSDLRGSANGKVAGVLTGLRRAAHEAIVIADDDVRYDWKGLVSVSMALKHAHVVRPQNYFEPLPWHAWLDTGRTLINRMTGGDWPGTLGVRRSILSCSGGYSPEVLFENLEMVRTVIANGGAEMCALGLYVRRKPPAASHFWSQRVRQAYDEFARPLRLTAWLLVAPLVGGLVYRYGWGSLFIGAAGVMIVAELGRGRANGRRVFPFAAVLAAPLWVAERAVCAWVAVGAYLAWGGIPYHGRIISRAATPLKELRQRHWSHGALQSR